MKDLCGTPAYIAP